MNSAAAFVPRFGYSPAPDTKPAVLDLRAVYALLTGPALRQKTARVQAAPAGSIVQAGIINTLPTITTAGVFASRCADENLTQFSRCLLLDFEQVPSVAAARAALLADPVLGPEILLLFDSPQGRGFRAIVAAFPGAPGCWPASGQPDLTPTEARQSLAANFLGWSIHVQAWHGLRARPHTKTLTHACRLGHDPAAWLAPGW
jgi:hypothetical protein